MSYLEELTNSWDKQAEERQRYAKPFSELIAKLPQEEQDRIKEMSEQMIKNYNKSFCDGTGLIGKFAWYENNLVFMTEDGAVDVLSGELVRINGEKLFRFAKISLAYALGGGINLQDLSDYDILYIADRFFYSIQDKFLIKCNNTGYYRIDGYFSHHTDNIFPCIVTINLDPV